MTESLTREKYAELIGQADAALHDAIVMSNQARDAERRAIAKLDKAWLDFKATYPIKSANTVNKERLASQQDKLQSHVDAGGDPRGFLGERRPEAASALDANRIYSKGGNVNSGVGIQRRGGFGVEHKGKILPSKHPGE